MSRTISRRLTRLEKLVPQVIAEYAAWRRHAARDHAIKLTTLILHGDPQIEEPLEITWRRALDRLGLAGADETYLTSFLRALVLERVPGDTENAKFAHVFSSAPPWLLLFCVAWADCLILGIERPKSSEPWPEPGWRALRQWKSWPELPTGTFGAGGPIPETDLFDRLTCEELHDLIRLCKKGEDNWSRYERRRYREIDAKVDEDKWCQLFDRRHSSTRSLGL
jgi:hypothetical protein